MPQNADGVLPTGEKADTAVATTSAQHNKQVRENQNLLSDSNPNATDTLRQQTACAADPSPTLCLDPTPTPRPDPVTTDATSSLDIGPAIATSSRMLSLAKGTGAPPECANGVSPLPDDAASDFACRTVSATIRTHFFSKRSPQDADTTAETISAPAAVHAAREDASLGTEQLLTNRSTTFDNCEVGPESRSEWKRAPVT